MPLQSRKFSGNARLNLALLNQPPLRKGERGEAVALVQGALIDLGYKMPGSTANGAKAPDGIYGDETVRVIWTFQGNNKLQQDGVTGHDTLELLDRLSAQGGEAQGLAHAIGELLYWGQRALTDNRVRLSLPIRERLELEASLRNLEQYALRSGEAQSSAFQKVLFDEPPRAEPETSTVPIPLPLIMLMAAALAIAAIAAQGSIAKSKPLPKPKLPDFSSPPPEVAVLAVGVASAALAAIKITAISMRDALNRCKDEHPDRVGPCADAIREFDEAVSETLKAVTTFTNGGLSRFPRAKERLEAARTRLNRAAEALARCLGCTNLGPLKK